MIDNHCKNNENGFLVVKHYSLTNHTTAVTQTKSIKIDFGRTNFEP